MLDGKTDSWREAIWRHGHFRMDLEAMFIVKIPIYHQPTSPPPTITDNRWMHFDNVWYENKFNTEKYTHTSARTNKYDPLYCDLHYTCAQIHTQHTQIPTNRMRQILIWRFAFKFKTELLLFLLSVMARGEPQRHFDWMTEWVSDVGGLLNCLLVVCVSSSL